MPGWIALIALFGTLTGLWWHFGESFFCHTNRQPAEVLIVEGWIGLEGMDAAKAEFENGGYRLIVTTGGLSGERGWSGRRWNFAEIARDRLVRLGVPQEKILVAFAENTENQRTFHFAQATRRALESHGLHPKAVNVFTLSVHSRRSRLVFAKAFPSETSVGVVSWIPSAYNLAPWWKSSERAGDLVKETVGYFFELLLNSGRWTNAPKSKEEAPPAPVRSGE